MTGSSLKYLIKEGFRNTWTNRMMSIASICVLLSCLVLIGSASMIFLNVNALVDEIEDENVIMVFIEDEADQNAIDKMASDLKGMSNVQAIEYIPKEQAWEEQLATMEKAQAEFFTDKTIPLPNAYKVTISDLALFNQTVKDVNELDNVEIVRGNSDLAKKIERISNGVSIFAIVIISVLFIISLFIISNTIKLTVYSRRLEISIMKSVGATNSFVRLPFVVEGMVLGVVSAIVSLGVVWGIYEFATAYFGDILSEFMKILDFKDYALYMLLAFLGIGVISGVGGSLITMGKYLNKEGSEISGI